MRHYIGFTLNEITIVIVILGIVAIMAIPTLYSSDPYNLDPAAEATANAIRFARSEAIRTGQTHGVEITPANLNRLSVHTMDISVGSVALQSPLHLTLISEQSG